MHITAKLLGGKDDSATFDIPSKVKVLHLKRKIADELLIPCESFKVLNGGKTFHDDDDDLVAAGLKDGAKLTVILNSGENAYLNAEMCAKLKAILGSSASPITMLRLWQSIRNYVDFMSLDDLERFAKKRTA